MRREQAAAVLAGTFLSLAAALAFVILPMCLIVGCYVVGTWLRVTELYTRGPLIRNVLTGMYVLAAVMVEELWWDLRFNPQWTRWWN